MKYTNTLVAVSAGYKDAIENYELYGASHAGGVGVPGGNPIEMEYLSNTISGSTGGIFLPVSLFQSGRLPPTALPFLPPPGDMTCVDVLHDEGCGNQGHDGSSGSQGEFPSTCESISQISAVAAEAASIAAALDVTLITSEILSTPDNTDDVHSGSPIVELVEETTQSTPASEIFCVVEFADTVATLDSPSGQFVIRPAVYAKAQSPERFHVDNIRTVPITDIDDFLVSVDQSATESGDESSDDAPEEYSSKQRGNFESIASVNTESDNIVEFGGGQVDCSLAKLCAEGCAPANTKEFRESSANKVLPAPLAGTVGENKNAESRHNQKLPEVFKQAIDPSGENTSGGIVMEAPDTTKGETKTTSQKIIPILVPPHLRKKFEPKPHLDISDSESSIVSAVSTLSTDQCGKSDSIDEFINSICIVDLTTIASNTYARSYGIATSTLQCVVDPHPRIGSCNAIYATEFSEKDTARKHKWAILVPLRGRYFSNTEKSWLESDIRAMEFIKERTDIPIPYIYGYDCSTQNKIGTPYILMDFIGGDRVEDVWEDWTEEKRLLCLSQCAESMRKLGRFGFSCIGVLGCGYRKGKYAVHGIPSDTKGNGDGTLVAGPFPSTKAYLDNIWRTKTMGLESNITPDAVKNKQFLVLLKLLIPALVDLEPATHHFFLSLPEFGGGNVLVDHHGNVTGFVGWKKVMIMPKAMGYTRYPEWIIKDWISPQEKSPVPAKQPEKGTSKLEVDPGMNRKSLAKASLGSGKKVEAVKDSKGVSRRYLLEEGEDTLGGAILNFKTSTPSRPKVSDNGDTTRGLDDTPGTIHVAQGGLIDLPDVTSSEGFFPTSIDCLVPNDEAHGENGRWKRNKKGRNNRRNNRGNRQPVARPRQEYDESVELQRVTTDEDKTKVHAVSKWNALPEEITKKEADEREERKQARLAKEEEDKITGIKNESPMLPKVVETFKKVVVEKNLERKLLEVTKTERKCHLDETISTENIMVLSIPQIPKSNDMVSYRKIYHGLFAKIAPEDEMATKYSHMSTAIHTAITNDDLRSSIVPRLAKHVFGATVGPSLLGMVGNGQWAGELLAKGVKDRDGPKKGVRFASEDEQFTIDGEGGSDRSVWELLVLGRALVIGVVVVILVTSVGLYNKNLHKLMFTDFR